MPQLSNNTMNISKMTITRLKQELTQRGLPANGLVERLTKAMVLKNSNEVLLANRKGLS